MREGGKAVLNCAENNVEMAAVNMRLQPGAVRELHWHTTGEVSQPLISPDRYLTSNILLVGVYY